MQNYFSTISKGIYYIDFDQYTSKGIYYIDFVQYTRVFKYS